MSMSDMKELNFKQKLFFSKKLYKWLKVVEKGENKKKLCQRFFWDF